MRTLLEEPLRDDRSMRQHGVADGLALPADGPLVALVRRLFDAALSLDHTRAPKTEMRQMPNDAIAELKALVVASWQPALRRVASSFKGISQRLAKKRAELAEKTAVVRSLSSDGNRVSSDGNRVLLTKLRELCTRKADLKRKYVRQKLAIVYMVAACLKQAGYVGIVQVAHARVPVVKLVDLRAGNSFTANGSIACDVCINNVMGVVNSALLREYACCDERCRKLMFLVKVRAELHRLCCGGLVCDCGKRLVAWQAWARHNHLNEASKGTLYADHCAYNMQPAMCSIEHITCNLQCATYNIEAHAVPRPNTVDSTRSVKCTKGLTVPAGESPMRLVAPSAVRRQLWRTATLAKVSSFAPFALLWCVWLSSCCFQLLHVACYMLHGNADRATRT
jgi:hypothetical protein